MKRTLLSLTLFLAVACTSLHALPVDLSIPPGGLGPTSGIGAASHWVELAEIDFGQGLSLPLRLSFLSSRKDTAPDFGLGYWRTPLHDSRLLDKKADEWTVMLPCGKMMKLSPVPDAPDTWSTADGEWTATAKGPNTLVSREDGWEMEFNSRSQLIRLRNDAGRNILWSRTADGAVQSLAELVNGKLAPPAYTVSRDAATGHITSQAVRTAHGLRRWTYAYDAQARLSAVQFPDTSSVLCAYADAAPANPSITITGRDLIQTSLTWHRETRALLSDGTWSYTITPVKNNNPIMTRTGPYGETESQQDDEVAALNRFTSAEGTTTIRQKVKTGPAKGKLESITRLSPANAANNGQQAKFTLYTATYDAKGLLATETDALGHTTTHSYTLHGSSIHTGIKTHTTTDPLNASSTQEFDKHGNLIANTNALGHITRYEFDSQNRRTRTLAPDGTAIETLAYSAAGQLATRTDALGATTQFGYDNEGNRTSVTDALGHVTRSDFDKRGNRTRSIDALGRVTVYQYDAGSRVVRVTQPTDGSGKSQVTTDKGKGPEATENSTTTYTYDAQGHILTSTDAAGNTTRSSYDKLGRIASRTDALDRTTSYGYDVQHGSTGCVSCSASGLPTLITSPSGRKTARRYDADRHLIEETLAFGTPQAATTRHAYDLAGNLIKTTDALGRNTEYRYDASNRRVAMIFPDKTERHSAYDAAGQLIAETDELGNTTKRSYDAHGNLATVTDPAGNETTTLFTPAPGSTGFQPVTGGILPPHGKGEAKNLSGLTNTPGPIEAQYRAAHRPTGQKSPAGVITQNDYDLLGRRIAQIIAPGTPDAAITRHDYDAVGNEIKTTGPTGKITLHRYDAQNRRIATLETLPASVPAPETQPSKISNLQSSIVNPAPRTWTYSYTPSTGPTGNPPCCGADPTANARAHTTTFPDGTQETRITDAAGQLVETIDAKGDHIKYAYDPDGRLTTLTDANNHETRWSYDPRGKLELKTYPDRSTEAYDHDLAGQLITRTRPDGTAAVNTYDARGHLLNTVWKRTSPAEPNAPQLPGESRYAYDAAGHLTRATNPSAEILRTYTPSGKIASEEQKITASFEEGESDKGQVVSGKPGTSPTTESVYLVQYGYNPDNKLASIEYPDHTQIGYRYNDHGQLAQVTEALPTPSPLRDSASPRETSSVLATYTRQADGQVTQLKLANGLTTTKTYDAVGRLLTIAHTAPDGSVLASETSRYDPRDRRTARISAEGQADLFAYDPAGQVIAAAYGQANVASASAETNPNAQPKPDKWQQTFAYDPAGNRKAHTDTDGTQTTYQTNEANQYTALSVTSESSVRNPPEVPTTPAYDKNGNLLKDTQNTYTWDADIHLLSVTTRRGALPAANETTTTRGGALPAANETTTTRKGALPAANDKTTTTHFRYDAMHRRVARLEEHPENGPQTLTHFIHDGWNVLAEYQSSAGLQPAPTAQADKPSSPSTMSGHGLKPTTTLVWGEDLSRTLQGAGGIAGLLKSSSVLNSELSAQYFSYDSNGNVILLTSPTSKPTARYSYDAFGKTTKATGEAAESNKYRFSTKPIEKGSGLAFYGFRYYSPALGRWTARDPLSEKASLNLLVNCSNSLTNNLDFLGRSQLPGTGGYFPAGPDDTDYSQNCIGFAMHERAWWGKDEIKAGCDEISCFVQVCSCTRHKVVTEENIGSYRSIHAYDTSSSSGYCCKYGSGGYGYGINDPLYDYLNVYYPVDRAPLIDDICGSFEVVTKCYCCLN